MGRTVGALNKNKDRLLRMLKAEYGEEFDPIMRMAEIAATPENDDSLKLSAWKEVAQYVYPKLKAIEQTHHLDEDTASVLGSTYLAARIATILTQAQTVVKDDSAD